MLETTKQHVIMNIDNPFTEPELNSKLRKLNKLTTSLIPGSTQVNKTLLTKGLMDTYRLVLESSIQEDERPPIVIAFK